MDNCISVFHKEQQDKVYRIYVTDSLKAITENTAHYAGGVSLRTRFIEILEPPKVDTRTEEEVVSSLMDKLRKV